MKLKRPTRWKLCFWFCETVCSDRAALLSLNGGCRGYPSEHHAALSIVHTRVFSFLWSRATLEDVCASVVDRRSQQKSSTTPSRVVQIAERTKKTHRRTQNHSLLPIRPEEPITMTTLHTKPSIEAPQLTLPLVHVANSRTLCTCTPPRPRVCCCFLFSATWHAFVFAR